MTCTKCGQAERAAGHAWCRGCQAAARKARREAKGVSNDVQPVSNVQSDVQRPSALVTALARITELEGEVARLKRELATANARVAANLGGGPVPLDARGVPISGFGRISGRGVTVTSDKQIVPHGPNCMGICCRSGRAG